MPHDLTISHAEIFELHRQMKGDTQFEALCRAHGLPWDLATGYEPRWYNGARPRDVQVLFLMAEPGAITPTEDRSASSAISHTPWIESYNIRLQEHYWRANLLTLCQHIWPTNTEAKMFTHLGGSCTFWMSLAAGVQTNNVPTILVNYFSNTYLTRFLSLFPNAIVVAAGAKARDRLRKLNVRHLHCSALTRPESNKPAARESWRTTGMEIARLLD